jgi:Putative beta barrel porin-7 (BBP7)
MTKPWFTVVVAWLAAGALAVAQAPADPPRPQNAPSLPAGPGACPVYAVPFTAPPPPPPTPMNVTGIITPPEQPPMAWAGVDYLLWWMKNGPVPPLVTTAPLTAVTPGAIGDPQTTVLFGGSKLDYHSMNGGRFTAGLWLDYQRDFGFEASGFLFSQNTVKYHTASDENGTPFLAQPFYDVTLGQESVATIAFPNAAFGSIDISSASRLGGAEGNFLKPLMVCDGFRLEAMAGFHYLNLSEDLEMTTNTGITAGFAGTFPLFFLGGQTVDYPQVLQIKDTFRTQSNFYGGQIGLRARWDFAPFYVRAQAEVAVGGVENTVNISGSTTVLATPGGVVLGSTPGGLFAALSNSGKHDSSQIAVLPSGEIKVGYEVVPNVMLEIGYSGLFLNNVVRPGSFIERAINPGQTPSSLLFGPNPSPLDPIFRMNTTTIWAEGLSVGVTVTY